MTRTSVFPSSQRFLGVFFFVAILFVVGGTLALAWYAKAKTQAEQEIRFEKVADLTSEAIAHRLETYIGALRGVRGYFASEKDISSVQFSTYMEHLGLLENYPGLQGVGFSKKVVDKKALEYHMREMEGIPDFRIFPTTSDVEAHAIVYLYPLDRRNRAAIGFNMMSEPVRRAAMERSRDSGLPAASHRVTLIQEIDTRKQAGFLIYLPVYAGGVVPASVDERRRLLLGFVYCPVRADDFFTHVIGPLASQGIGFRVYDKVASDPDSLLHDSSIIQGELPAKYTPSFTMTRQISLEGATWSIAFYNRPERESFADKQLVPLVLLAGIFLTSVLGLAAFSRLRSSRRLSEERARGDEQKEWLRVTLSSIGDAVMATDILGRIIFINPIAESVSGWKGEEARGQSLENVFKIIDENSRQVVVDPVSRVMSTGQATSLHTHAVLMTKSGQEIPVECNAAPIRTPDGTSLGIVLVFRDVSERQNRELINEVEQSLVMLIAHANDFGALGGRILQTICEKLNWDVGALWIVDPIGHQLSCLSTWEEVQSPGRDGSRGRSLQYGEGIPGRVLKQTGPLWITNVKTEGEFLEPAPLGGGEFHTAIAFPLIVEGRVTAVLEFYSKELRSEDPLLLRSLTSISSQLGQLIERKESEVLNSSIVQASLDGIVTIDGHGIIREFNPVAEESFGYTRQEAIGAQMSELLIPPELRDAHAKGMSRYLSTGEAKVLGVRIEMEAMRKGGSRFPIEIAITRIPQSGPALFTAFIRDVTLQRQAKEELRRSEERFRQLANSIPQLAWMARPDGSIFWFNDRWYEFTGLTFEECEGWKWERLHAPGERWKLHQRWKDLLQCEEFFSMEFQLCGIDGSFRWFLTRVVPVKDNLGKVILWFGTNTDVTEQKTIAEERAALLEAERAARTAAEHASRMKDEFLATLSHELRTPLNAILGWAQLVRRQKVPPEQLSQGLDVIERNARVQAQIIDDLLDMNRIVSGKVRLDVQSVELEQVLNDALQTVGPSAAAKSIRIVNECALRTEYLKGDPHRLQQVFWNLLSNAVKFTPPDGTIRLTSDVTDSHIVIAFTDSGSGIRPAFLPHVFDRFRQADASTTRKHGGLGLGLAIVKSLVELHGGSIQASSEGEGKGATFTVTLPREFAVSEGGQALPSRAATVMQSQRRVDLQGLKFLVVDDQEDSRELIGRLLVDSQGEVTTTDSARSALTFLQKDRYDLIISDIGMPDIDGYEFIKLVRALPASAGGETPAVAVTAFARDEDKQLALRCGYHRHLAKPVESADLFQAIEELTLATKGLPNTPQSV